jgi:hypothetical protein
LVFRHYMIIHFDIVTIFETLWQIGSKLTRWFLPFFWHCAALSLIKWDWLQSVMDRILSAIVWCVKSMPENILQLDVTWK